MSSPVDVAIIGAGPYGLSLAAHLRDAGVPTRIFGRTMDLWRRHMPKGMYLKSQGFASNLSDPAGSHTLERFCRATDRLYAHHGVPVSLETFLAYGEWFAAGQVPHLEAAEVTGLATRPDGFELTLDGGERVLARSVVVAVGVQHFAYTPEVFAPLGAACTHSSLHDDLSPFRGSDVIVVGAGQSALESAALLHENGAGVRLLVREDEVLWNGDQLAPDRPIRRKVREPEAGLGSGWGTWFYSTQPALFTRLPGAKRIEIALTALGPAGADWLRPRVEDKLPIMLRHLVTGTGLTGGQARLTVSGPEGTTQLTADHVITATGYRVDLRRLAFLDPALLAQLRTTATSPRVDRTFQTSVPGLYVIGPAVANTFGPVMRFVYGSAFAARTVAARLSGTGAARRPLALGGYSIKLPGRPARQTVGADR